MALLTNSRSEPEKDLPALESLNQEFKAAYVSILDELNHIKDMLRGMVLHPQRLDLKKWLADFLQQKMSHGSSFYCVTDELHADVDPLLMSGALSEMIQNSADAASTPEALQVSLTVESFLFEDTEYIRILYLDRGPGIPQELKAKIFDDFFTRRVGKPAGVGVGLTYVKRAVLTHGGTIREDGTSGQGARFVIEFPRWVVGSTDKEEGNAFANTDR